MNSEIMIVVGLCVGTIVGWAIGTILGTIVSDIYIWKRPWREAVKFWRME